MGATSRQSSTKAGLEAWADQAPGMVLIHDAVRPLIDHGTISRVVAALADATGVVPGLPIADTLRRSQAGISSGTVDRTDLWRMQTPQGFHFQTILEAHRSATRDDYTDDAAILEAAGQTVRIVPGHINNMKITTPENLVAAEQILMNELNDIRTGMGFDVHQFGPGTSIFICGVEIPHDKTAVGHLGCRCRPARADGRDFRRHRRGRHRHPLPAERPAMARGGQCRLPETRGIAGGKTRRDYRQCGYNLTLRGAKDRPAPAGDEATGGGYSGHRRGSRGS